MGTKTTWYHKLGSAVLTLAILLALAQTVSCGRGGLFRRHRGEGGAVGSRAAVGTTVARPTPPRVESLDAVLKDIDAYQPPPDVNAATFAMLKAELKRLLIARASAEQKSGKADGKHISIAPSGAPNAVTDLAATANPAGTQATLTWSERLPGDYDNDGRAWIPDLVPLAKYYMQHADTGPYDGHRLINDDPDPELNIADLQPVVANYDATIQGYQVVRGTGDASAQTWEPVIRPNPNPDLLHVGWTADRPSPPPVSCRPTYGFTDDISGIGDKAHVVYKVVPLGDGATGAESNVAVMTTSGLANSPWPKYHANAQNAGTSQFIGAQTNSLRWTFETGTYIESSPALGVDGTVYIGCDDHNLYALDGGTGALKWASLLDGEVNTSPAVGLDGTIYVGLRSANVHALNASDGSVKWTFNTGGTSTESPAVGDDGTVYIGCDNGNLYALNPLDGSVKWSYSAGARVENCPAIGADGTIFIGVRDPALFGTGATVHAVRRDGTRRWKLTAGCSDINSPAVGSDGYVIVTGEMSPMIASVSPSDGSGRWSASLGVIVSSAPTVGPDGTVYVSDSAGGMARLTAFRGSDGTIEWRLQTDDMLSNSSPSCGADGTLFIGGRSNFYSLSAADGSVKWSYPTREAVFSSPAIGADGTIYAASSGAVYAFGTPMPNTHSVSGRITESGGSPEPGVKVSLLPSERVCHSKADGTFSLVGVPDGVYTLQPELNGYSFAPPNRLVVVSGADVIGQDFIAAQGAGSISGTVLTAAQTGVGGVTLTLTPGGRTALTKLDGSYRFDSVAVGIFIVTPMKPGYTFDPTTRLVPVTDGQTIGANFTAIPAPPGHSVSGKVTYLSGAGVGGVAVYLTPGSQNATTGSDGSYTITDVSDGSYTLTPVKAGYAFTPPNRAVTVSGADVAGQDFTAATGVHNVSGRVTDSATSAGVPGVLVTLTPGGLNATTVADGTYVIKGVADGNYTATPSKPGRAFTPPDRPVIVSGADVTGVDFTATVAYSVSGKVTDSMGFGVQGVTMTLTPGGLSATTLVDGTYAIANVVNGGYTLTPSKFAYSFAPANRAVTVSGADVSGQDFAVVGGLANSAWPRVSHDARNTGQSSYVGVQTNAVKWYYKAGGSVSSPIIGEDGTIYVGSSDKNIYALNPADGSVRWSLPGPNARYPAAVGSGGTIYASDSTGSMVYAINAADGSVKWSAPTSGSPTHPSVGPDGTIYVGTSESAYAGKLYALAPLDGTVKWILQMADAADSSPAIGPDGTIYVAGHHYSSGYVYTLNAVNPDGTLKWTVNAGNRTAPSIGADGTLYLGAAWVYAMSPADGSVLWQSANIGANSTPAIGANGTLYVATGSKQVYALSEANGSTLWSALLDGSVSSLLAVGADQTLYVGTSYVGAWPNYTGDVYALNGTDGSVKWEYLALAGVYSPAIGADGSVYVSGDRLYAFNTPTNSFSISGTITDAETGLGLAGATVTLLPGYQTTTGSDGTYIFTGVVNGTYTVTPTHPTHWMNPVYRTVTVLNGDVTGVDFTAGTGGLANSAWPKFHGNVQNTGLSPYVGIQVENLKWTFQTGNYIVSSPVIGADGTIYVGSNDSNVYALNSSDGSLKWVCPVTGLVYGAPAVGAAGTVFVSVAYNGNAAYAINPADGSVKWMVADFDARSSPSIGVDGTVYAPSAFQGGGAFNQADGSLKPFSLSAVFYASPALAPDGTIYLGCWWNRVDAVNPWDGSLKWTYGTSEVESSPAVGADGTVYFGCQNYNLYALNPADGSQKWVTPLGGWIRSSPAIGPSGTIYVGCNDGKLYSVNPTDGSIIDTFTTGGAIYSSPAIGALETVYFGSDDGYVYAINGAVDPKIPMWTYQTGGAVRSSPAIGADGTVYVGCNDGKVYAFGQ